jgi:hypothetical protein
MEPEYSDVTPNPTTIKTYKFSCEICMYKCDNKFSYNKHLSTQKHLKLNSDIEKTQEYTCTNCNNSYKHMSSLCKHKRTCAVAPVNCTESATINSYVTSPTDELVNVITDYVKNSEKMQRESIELSKQLIELYKIMILSHNPDADIN